MPSVESVILHDALVRYLLQECRDCDRDRDVASFVFHTALRNFTVPEDWRGFRKYISHTAKWLRKNKHKEAHIPKKEASWTKRDQQFIDPDCQVYYPWAAAQELGLSERTVRRDMKKYGSTPYEGQQGISPESPEAADSER